jgi:CO dehydrogenase nickel-insertion accessory protein CooC1
MDSTYNFGVEKGKINYLGGAMQDLLRHAALKEDEHYTKIIESKPDLSFNLNPVDSFSEKYTAEIKPGLRIMSAGPHTDDVLYGKSCSHILGTPLKIYLPLLDLKEKQFVVVDEKAGSDGVGTGIASGFTYAFVVAEPTPHGIKAAHQIADLLDFYGTPYSFVINKVGPSHHDSLSEIKNKFKKEPDLVFNFSESYQNTTFGDAHRNDTFRQMKQIVEGHIKTKGDDRKKRSIEKFLRNKDYKNK